MADNRYKALILDLDGTLINREEVVSPRVAQAVDRASTLLSVSIASGREPADVFRYARQLGLTGPQISDGGANIIDPSTGQSLWSAPLGAVAGEVLERLEGLDEPIIATHLTGTFRDIRDIGRQVVTRVSVLDMDAAAAERLVAEFSSNGAITTVKVFLPYNSLWAVDFTLAGVDKSTAVIRFGEIVGVDPRRMIAVGDSFNDVPLLKACGLRIAMAGAPPELLSIAHYVAPSVEEDGLAVAIDEFILPRV